MKSRIFLWLILEPEKSTDHSTCQFKGGQFIFFFFKRKMQGDFDNIVVDKEWLNMATHKDGSIKKPNELENEMTDPPDLIDEKILDRIQGSLIGLAIGDALGAHVEFRPREYLLAHPVTDMEGGGQWSLKKGEVCFFKDHFLLMNESPWTYILVYG